MICLNKSATGFHHCSSLTGNEMCHNKICKVQERAKTKDCGGTDEPLILVILWSILQVANSLHLPGNLSNGTLILILTNPKQ